MSAVATWGSIMQAEEQSVAVEARPQAMTLTQDDGLTKRQLAERLSRSTRFVEARQQEGMPSELGADGRRYYRWDEVRPWLEARERAQKARRSMQQKRAGARVRVRLISAQIGRVDRRSNCGRVGR